MIDLPSKLKKAACFTDIHWGAKSNSEVHNMDCLRFIKWFCDNVTNDPEIDHIMFLGDWFENRSNVNIATLNHAYNGAKMLNALGLPVFFIVGNHDLYHRHTREIHSVVTFKEFTNFVVVDEPLIVENIGNGGALISPYLFHEEYPNLQQYLRLETWWGHFEFKGFIITGYDMAMPTGPDPTNFKGPKHIVSGHFHKRQANGNIVYMGNAFPLNFNDAGDVNRGMMTYDHFKDEMIFINWDECPKFIKTKLSDLLDKTVVLYPDARVKCIVDVPISFEESTFLKQSFTERYKLREFTLEEAQEIREAISNTDANIDWKLAENTLATVDELVRQMLMEIESDHIDNQTLITIYNELTI